MKKLKSFIFTSSDNEIMQWIVCETGFSQTDIIRIAIRMLQDAIINESLGKYESYFCGIKDINEIKQALSFCTKEYVHCDDTYSCDDTH